MKPDLKTELRQTAESITPRAEFLEWGHEHLRIQARARRQTTKGPFEPTYTPRKQPASFFPYRSLTFGTAVIALFVVGTQLPSVQHALHQSENPFFHKTGAFLEQHSLPVPFLNSSAIEIHEKAATSSQATSSSQNHADKDKKAVRVIDNIDVDTATNSQPAAAAAGVRPSMIETLKKVITLPSLPSLPDAVDDNNGKKPDKELPEQATKPDPDDNNVLPEEASEQATLKKPQKDNEN